MPDTKSKPAIPAWQRQTGDPTQDEVEEHKSQESEQSQHLRSEAEKTGGLSAVEEQEEKAIPTVHPRPNEPRAEDVDDVDKVRKFLDHASLQSASLEKKREFLRSKGVARDIIDQAVGQSAQAIPELAASEFSAFQQSSHPQSDEPARMPGRRDEPAPPIITYPEFLVNAHKPPPLVTTQNVVGAAYVFGGISALIYGASKFLCEPMSAALNDARHELAAHSQSKLDQLNERLSRLASREPDMKRHGRGSHDTELADEDSSVNSDPSELFHRDIGVQTSPTVSKAVSVTDGSDENDNVPDVGGRADVDRQTRDLQALHIDLSDIFASSQRLASAGSEREESYEKLQRYLDTLLYPQPGGNMMWGAAAMDEHKEQKSDDSVDKLKNEIRKIKGMMLSAKRFPAATAR